MNLLSPVLMPVSRSVLLLTSVIVLSLILHAADEPFPQFQMPPVQEPKIPNLTLNVTDFGAVPDGKTLNTDAIANAIAALAEKGGGRLTFPPGIWLTGPIGLESKVELHTEAGTLILFTPDFKQYPVHTVDYKGRNRTLTVSPIHGENLEDIAISGRGVFDGSGDAWRPVKKSKMTGGQWKTLVASGGNVATNGNDQIWSPSSDSPIRRPNLMKLMNCRRVLLDGPTFQNSPGWNLNPTLCEDLTLRNITVRNPWYSQNGDGLDLEHCRNVILRDSSFDVGDDAICLKSGSNEEGRRIAVPTENVLVENCTVYHGHGGFTIGSEMSSGVRNVRVNNCTFIGTDVGLRFKSTRGRGGVIEDIFISNVRMTGIPTDAIRFNLFYGGQSPTETDGAPIERNSVPVSEATPQFRNIWIQDVTCRGAKTAVAMQGLPEMPIRGIHLKKVSITSNLGITCNDAQGITLENVEILNTAGPVVSLAGSRDFQIDRLTFKSDVQTLFKADGPNNAAITVKNTDLKSAKQDFSLRGGATRDAFKVQ